MKEASEVTYMHLQHLSTHEHKKGWQLLMLPGFDRPGPMAGNDLWGWGSDPSFAQVPLHLSRV